MSIEHQYQVVLKILNMLEGGDPYAILAGGAPRDWYFGNIANDLDFYVYLPKTITSLTKGWATDFLVKNLDIISKPDYSMFEHTLNTIDKLNKETHYV